MKSEILFLCNSQHSLSFNITFHVPAFPVLSQVCHLFFLDLWTDSVTQKDTLWGAGWQWGATGLKARQIDSHSAVYYSRVKELKCRVFYFIIRDGEDRKIGSQLLSAWCMPGRITATVLGEGRWIACGHEDDKECLCSAVPSSLFLLLLWKYCHLLFKTFYNFVYCTKKKKTKNFKFYLWCILLHVVYSLRISIKTIEADDSSQNQNLMVKWDQTHKELITLALIKCSLFKRKKKKKKIKPAFILARSR